MDVQHPGELVGEKPCAREHALVEECWEPFALHRVYYCYRRRTCVATCEDTLIERAAHRDQDAFARVTCLACRQVHLVNPKSAEVIDEK